MRSSRQSINGKRGEDTVIQYLRMIGFLRVERIGTPVISCVPILVGGRPSGRFDVRFGEKVSGDVHCMLPGGKSVLAETKTTTGPENLVWSQLEEHQPERLTLHEEADGVSLLVWNCPAGIFVMRWPVPGFDGPRKSIDYEKARRYRIERADELL